MSAAAAQPRPQSIIVRGHPDDVQLAALSAALMALAAAAAEQPDESPARTTPQGWRSRSRQLRIRPAPGSGAWKASVRP